MPQYSAEDKLREVERELGYRKRLYPRWVKEGKMKQEQADANIAIMEAIAEDYAREMAQLKMQF